MPKSTGALLIHGMGGTEFDLGLLHKSLARASIDTHGVTLPGHGTRPEDLLAVRYEDWMDTVESKYTALMQQYDEVHVVGMCMGALLAVELCKRQDHQRGKLVSLAAPVYINGWSTPWYRGLRHILYAVPAVSDHMKVEEETPFGIKNDLVRAVVKAKFERGDNFHYRWIPLSCVRQVDRLRAAVKRGLDRIHCPTLIMHAEEDELTSTASARFLNARIPNSRYIELHNSYHMICVDNDRNEVASEVLSFFGKDPALARPAGVRARRHDKN